MYRLIDFRRTKDGVPAKVNSIEYDPNRSARIALLHYVDGEKRYIIAPEGLVAGDTVVSGEKVEAKTSGTACLWQAFLLVLQFTMWKCSLVVAVSFVGVRVHQLC